MIAVVAIILFIALCIWFVPFIIPIPAEGIWGINETMIVNTTVNITNAAPEVRHVVLQDPINLEAYGNTTITCNATVFDWDNDTLVVNATIYIYGVTGPESQIDGNNKYHDVNCTRISAQNQEMNFTCNVSMIYYADNSSFWECNVTAKDDDNATHANVSSYSTVNPLVALYVPGMIDYGELMVNEISDNRTANLTNAGNRDINITVEGYAQSRGDGLAMNCTYGTIAVQYEKYNVTAQTDYNTEMKSLTTNPVSMQGLIVDQRTSETQESLNVTYWRLQVPPFAGGLCTGKIMFIAADSQTN